MATKKRTELDVRAYPVVVTRIVEDDGEITFKAQVPQFKESLNMYGDSPESAIGELYEAIPSFIKDLEARGFEVPLPPGSGPALDSFSGKFLVRVPKSLHAALNAAADQEGVSLNSYVQTVLAGAVKEPLAGGYVVRERRAGRKQS